MLQRSFTLECESQPCEQMNELCRYAYEFFVRRSVAETDAIPPPSSPSYRIREHHERSIDTEKMPILLAANDFDVFSHRPVPIRGSDGTANKKSNHQMKHMHRKINTNCMKNVID